MEVEVKNNRVYITHEGVTKTLSQWCAEYSVDKKAAYSRLRKGWDFEGVFSKEDCRVKYPTRVKKRGCTYCADYIDSKCIHKECPYHELDNVKSYEEYLRKAKKNGLIKILESI